MLRAEAVWFRAQIEGFPPDETFPMLNVGSSTREFRTRTQPWIDEQLFAPARQRGQRVIHLDLKDAVGVDVVGDLSDPVFRERLRAMNVRSVLCSNLLEHVIERDAICCALVDVLPPGGLLFVSCPHRYPRHDDPIDTMYRPSVADLAAAFPGAELVAGEVLFGGTYYDDLGRSPARLARTLVRAAMPFYAPHGWRATIRHLPWLRRHYEQTCVVLRKIA